jgi:hypothetical protein
MTTRSTPAADLAELAGHPFVPSRFEGLIGAYHQSLATAGLPVTLADTAACSSSPPRLT